LTKITIAGASGFVGQKLLQEIAEDFSVKALSRYHKKSNKTHIQWVSTDLFSLQSTIDALKDTDIAIYLVHSMLPSSRLFQGSFQDTDLLLADNFAQACVAAKVKQIIYLGGLVPDKKISKHLLSRKEVEETLKSTGIPTTILRAGMVVGNGGSSFEILKNLVLNLPIMILPQWTQNQTQVIFIQDLIDIIKNSIHNPDFFNKTIDVINGEKMTYKDLICQTSHFLMKKKLLLPVPINYIGLSKWWVKIFGEAHYELVSPLIDSLLCEFNHQFIDPLIRPSLKYKTYHSMLKNISHEKVKKLPKSLSVKENFVRSIQRLPNPNQLSSLEISQKYMEWLPSFFKYIISIKRDGDIIHFILFHFKSPLLILKRVKDLNHSNRIKFHIVGGLLSKTTDTGWLEFRVISGRNFTITGIHNFVPSLPWYIYKFSQALLHEFVIKKFSKTLSTLPIPTKK
jgi:uncharacterized protein YbjT (DUF2867 family)